MRKILSVILIFIIMILSVSCGKNTYKDGEYTGEYMDDPIGEQMKVDITIKDNRITSCTIKAYTKDGKLKDETYGDGLEEKDDKRAKIAYEGILKYQEELVKKQDVDKVDVVSGATTSYDEFRFAIKDALEKAEK